MHLAGHCDMASHLSNGGGNLFGWAGGKVSGYPDASGKVAGGQLMIDNLVVANSNNYGLDRDAALLSEAIRQAGFGRLRLRPQSH